MILARWLLRATAERPNRNKQAEKTSANTVVKMRPVNASHTVVNTKSANGVRGMLFAAADAVDTGRGLFVVLCHVVLRHRHH